MSGIVQHKQTIISSCQNVLYIIYVHIITELNISITYHKFNVLSELFCWKSAGGRKHKQSLIDNDGGLKKKNNNKKILR